MPYLKISMSDLPPCLVKNKSFTYQNLNALIVESFATTTLSKTAVKNPYNDSITKIFLDNTRVKNIIDVTVKNLKGSSISYTSYLNTYGYSNYIDLNRPLCDNEELTINYTMYPGETDVLKSDHDNVYINDKVYKNLIEKLYLYIKGVNKNGKN